MSECATEGVGSQSQSLRLKDRIKSENRPEKKRNWQKEERMRDKES